MSLWAAKWISLNHLDGRTEYLILREWWTQKPILFNTRKECRRWIEEHYGYIRRRKDLRTEPHGWRLPMAVRVTVGEDKQRDKT